MATPFPPGRGISGNSLGRIGLYEREERSVCVRYGIVGGLEGGEGEGISRTMKTFRRSCPP